MAELDLIIRLAHELGCALELGYSPDQIKSETWSEAIDALSETRHFLLDKSVAVPEVMDTVLRTAREVPEPVP